MFISSLSVVPALNFPGHEFDLPVEVAYSRFPMLATLRL